MRYAAFICQQGAKRRLSNPFLVIPLWLRELGGLTAKKMMLDAGTLITSAPEMRLMWYKMAPAVLVCNTILDYAVHTQNMSKQDALHLLTHEAFQQEAEADGKWKRVSVTSVQLDSYFTGYKEIMDLREAYKKKMGDKYKLKDFNEKFLSYGSAPVRYIRESMLAKEPVSRSSSGTSGGGQ